VRDIEFLCGRRRLCGSLGVPPSAQGLVVFAHGSGSGRHSPRNQFVAGVLRENNLATFLADLLEEQEADDREKVFNIPLLAERLEAAADAACTQPECQRLSVGYFGGSTGAAAALVAAARRPDLVGAVVSRGGRPDLAAAQLPAVKAPTLLIVGSQDADVLRLNEYAATELGCHHRLVVIPGATHLFPEPGALEEVAELAARWFGQYLNKAIS
jgi:putative phosphoribosyl transferase